MGKWVEKEENIAVGIEDPNYFGYEYSGIRGKNPQCYYFSTTYITPTRTHI